MLPSLRSSLSLLCLTFVWLPTFVALLLPPPRNFLNIDDTFSLEEGGFAIPISEVIAAMAFSASSIVPAVTSSDKREGVLDGVVAAVIFEAVELFRDDFDNFFELPPPLIVGGVILGEGLGALF